MTGTGQRAEGGQLSGLSLRALGGLGPEGVVWEPRVLQACWEGRCPSPGHRGDLGGPSTRAACGTRQAHSKRERRSVASDSL